MTDLHHVQSVLRDADWLVTISRLHHQLPPYSRLPRDRIQSTQDFCFYLRCGSTPRASMAQSPSCEMLLSWESHGGGSGLGNVPPAVSMDVIPSVSHCRAQPIYAQHTDTTSLVKVSNRLIPMRKGA